MPLIFTLEQIRSNILHMRIAISIFGKDRPGIIAKITKSLADLGGNIEDASMTLLQGYFAMILVVELSDEDTVQKLRSGLSADESLAGFTISFSQELDSALDVTQEYGVAKYIFQLAVSDTPGIVSNLTRVLAGYGANIVDCATRKNNETELFTMILDVDIPIDKENEIVEELSKVATSFSGDVIFQRVDDVDL